MSPSRLSDIETKGILPNIYRLYSLSVIYRRDLREMLAWYGIELGETALDMALSEPPRSHISEALDSVPAVSVPVHLDPGFDPRRTVNLGRVIERWGLVPLAYGSPSTYTTLAQIHGTCPADSRKEKYATRTTIETIAGAFNA